MAAFMRKSFLATVLFFAFLAFWPAATPDQVGPARVIDGDTIVINGERHRLFGIDAVELGQTCITREGHAWPCGRDAAEALRRFLAGRTVGCDVRERDVHGRHVSICHAGTDNLSAWAVREGWAVADRNAPRLLRYPAFLTRSRCIGALNRR